MSSQFQSCDFTLESADNGRLANLCGQFDEHLRQVEDRFGVEINNRGNTFQIIGEAIPAHMAEKAIRDLYAETTHSALTPDRVHLILQKSSVESQSRMAGQDSHHGDASIALKRKRVFSQGPNQRRYVENLRRYDISFGVGPAGTGKTYLAVAAAVEALETERVSRLLLVRPAVEAGERLGFLPGDMAQKVDPYLRPLYDALYEMLGFERVGKFMEQHIIELAPLAFMRGRTLNHSFVILDEAQNTTVEQMKMFLTRIGFGSVAVITGDVTQVDLPKDKPSGLAHAIEALKDVDDISFTFFQSYDVVRHALVQKIVDAYDRFEQRRAGGQQSR